MRRIGTYLRSFGQSVREKPLVFAIFIITVIMSVVVSGTFYRKTKMQIEGFDEFTHYTINGDGEIFDSVKLYENLPKTNIKQMSDKIDILEKYTNEDGISATASITIRREYFESECFSQSELDSHERISVISLEYADLFDTKIGDEISIGDEKFKVIKKISGQGSRMVYIPAGCSVKFDVSQMRRTYVTAGCLGKMSAKTTDIVTGMGLTVDLESTFDVSILITILLSMGVIALTAVNIFMCFRFIAKKNSRRYTLFRTMGAKGYDIGIMMALESLVVTIIAFIIGMFIDYGITYGLAPDYMSKLSAVDYVWLFIINIATVFLTTIALIVKKIKAQPQDAKQRGA